MDHVSQHLPQPFRDRLVAASKLVDEASRMQLYRNITKEAKEEYPHLFLTDEEAEAMSWVHAQARDERERKERMQAEVVQ